MVAVIVVLAILWLLGYIRIPGFAIPDITLFVINGRGITLFEICIFLLMMYAVEILPSPLRQIVMVLFLLWVLSTLGIISIAGFSSLLVIAVIAGLVLSLLQKGR